MTSQLRLLLMLLMLQCLPLLAQTPSLQLPAASLEKAGTSPGGQVMLTPADTKEWIRATYKDVDLVVDLPEKTTRMA